MKPQRRNDNDIGVTVGRSVKPQRRIRSVGRLEPEFRDEHVDDGDCGAQEGLLLGGAVLVAVDVHV